LKTTRGLGVLVDYRRAEDVHTVRIVKGLDGVDAEIGRSLENLKREELLEVVHAIDGCSEEYLKALPVIEAIYAALPDLESGLLNQHPFEFFVTHIMQVMGSNDFFPGMGESESERNDSIKQISAKITHFNLGSWINEGNALISRLRGEGFSAQKVLAFQLYWDSLTEAFDNLQSDVSVLISTISARDVGQIDVDGFVRKIHTHLGSARTLFYNNSAIAEEISEEVGRIMSKISCSIVESINALKTLIDERFQATQVYVYGSISFLPSFLPSLCVSFSFLTLF
jgi:hypothetical protein